MQHLTRPSVSVLFVTNLRFKNVENKQATGKSFAMRLTSYFFVRQKGTYKVFMLLGHRDTGKVVSGVNSGVNSRVDSGVNSRVIRGKFGFD